VGLAHDDAEYVAYACALASGLGYVDPTALDPEPARRFPIGFPLLLAPIVASAADGGAAALRSSWLGPFALVFYTVLAGIAVRRWAAVPGWAAVAIAAVIALSTQVLQLGALVLSDLPCAVLVLVALLMADTLLSPPSARSEDRASLAPSSPGQQNLEDTAGAPTADVEPRTPKVAAWMLIGVVFGAACLVRYAAVAPLLAVLVVARGCWPLAAGTGLVLAPWFAYRSLQGGSRYAGEFATFFDPSGTAPAAVARLLANGLGGWIVPPAAEADLGLTAILGGAAGLVVAFGAWRMRREAPLPALALVATAALACAWGLAYVWTERLLMSRLLLPVAPAAWAAFVVGARGLLALDPALAARGNLLGRAGLGLAAGTIALAIWNGPGVPREMHGVIARDYGALFGAVRRTVPLDGRVMAPLPAMTWLYTNRSVTGFPMVVVAGRDVTTGPRVFMEQLAERRVGWVLGAPKFYARMDVVAEVLVPAMRAHPDAFRIAWRSPRGDYALLAVDQAALVRALATPEAR
jgi:hypothetical protein